MGITYETVVSASKGDPAAIDHVLEAYDPYINSFAAVGFRDGAGKHVQYVDQHIKTQLQATLILAVLKFDTRRAMAHDESQAV